MTNSFLRQACTQPFLLHAIFDRHLQPDCLDDKGNSGRSCQPSLDWIMNSRRGKARLLEQAKFVEKKHSQKWFLDFTSPLSRLCLVKTKDLLLVADYLGLLLHSTDIARQITRQAVNNIMERFGKQGYTFALRRCQTLPVSKKWVTVLKEKLTRQAVKETGLTARVTQHGQMLLASVLAENPPELLEMLGLPEQLRTNADFQLGPEEKEQAANLCYATLKREVAPQWAPYFP